MTGSDPQAPVDSSPTVDVERAESADDYRLDLNARARWVATRACRSRAAYAVGHGYEEIHYVLRDLAVILGPTDARTDGDGKLVLEAVQVSRVADACHWLAVHARDDDLADDAALVAYALREAVDVDVAAEEDVEADEEQQVLPDGGQSSADAERCETCEMSGWEHTTEESLIPVWENPADYNRGEGPDYLGCTNCHTMRPVDTGIDRSERGVER